MQFTTRRVTYKLYPSASQKRAMMSALRMTTELYNAALEQRIEVQRRRAAGRPAPVPNLSWQESEAKRMREIEGWGELVHSHTTQCVLATLQRAFDGFFRRLRAGENPGFPRFKSLRRMRGWGYKANGAGYAVDLEDDWRRAHVTLHGIGRMRMRGQPRWAAGLPDGAPVLPADARFKAANVIREAEDWFLSMEVEIPLRTRPNAEGPAAGIDWGVESLATRVESGGAETSFPNPRLSRAELGGIKRLQASADAARKEPGKPNRARRKHAKRLARATRKLARKRRDNLHKVSAAIVARNAAIVVESLAVKDMTRKRDGAAGERKRWSGLVREILDTAPSSFYHMLGYKAEEAGSELITLDGRALKASQTCPLCLAVRKKGLGEREHSCPCGCVMGRDAASALHALLTAFRTGAVMGEPPGVRCAREARLAAAERRLAGKAAKRAQRALDGAEPTRRAGVPQRHGAAA